MDYFDGLNLHDYVQQKGPLAVPEFLPLAVSVAEALQAAHSRKILHRDVKPANVLVGRVKPSPPGGRETRAAKFWEVRLIDFGLALRSQAIQHTISTPAIADRTLLGGSVAGTLEYAAPEQMGKLPGVLVGPTADIYGYGKTCCYALFQTPQPRRQHWQQLAEPLADLLDQCLADNPRDRPASFAVVAALLRKLMNPVAGFGPTPTAVQPPAVPELEGPVLQIREALVPLEKETKEQRAEDAAWAAAEHEATGKSYVQYLRAYPQGRYADKARQLVDERLWLEVVRKGTAEAYQRYLQSEFGCRHAAEARQWLLNREEQAWQASCQDGSPEAYGNYLAAYPRGRHVEDARKQMREADDDRLWQTARGQGTLLGYQTYLLHHPQGKHAEQAHQVLDEMVWRSACEQNTAESYEKYLSAHARGGHVEEASGRVQERRDDEAWQTALQQGTGPAWEHYLAVRPQGRHVAEAEQRLQEWQDEQAWQEALKQKTVKACQGYLKVHPQGRHVEEARRVSDDLAWQMACQQGTSEIFEKYLAAFPQGRHIDEARVRLQQLADDQAWQTAQSLATGPGYEQYLTVQPQGRHVDEARQALVLWQDQQAWLVVQQKLGGPETPKPADAGTELDEPLQLAPAAGKKEPVSKAEREQRQVEAYEEYLQAHPKGQHAEEVRQWLQLRYKADDQAWQKAGETTRWYSSVSPLDQYLAAYPRGRHAEEARQRLQRDKEAWEKAQQSGTVEVFEQYLAAYPQGKYVGEAQKQVASLLRQQVLSNPQDTELRRCYLATPRH
jgi:hypothetical protein